jgi:hypothetical protein
MSAKPIPGRQTAAAEGDIVVFHIGMRINHFRAPRSWVPAFQAMPRMLRELSKDKAAGLLGYRLLSGGPRIFYVVQYWESKEKLLAYAADQDQQHRPAWTAFNRYARAGKGHVGIWHETYLVPAGSYEAIYADMPAFGLAAATGVIPVGRRGERARDRLAAA